MPDRRNSAGLPLWDDSRRNALLADIQGALEQPHEAGPIVAGEAVQTAEAIEIRSPHDRRVLVGRSEDADRSNIDRALALSQPQAWIGTGAAARCGRSCWSVPRICSRPTVRA